MFNHIFQKLNIKGNNRKHTKGRNVQYVPIFKRNKDGDRLLDSHGKPIVIKYKKIYHV